MSDRRRQQVLLIVLLVVLAVVVWWRLGPRLLGEGGGEPGRVMGIGASSNSPKTEKRPLPEVVELRLDDLESASDDVAGGRDPFNVEQPAPELAPPPEPSQNALREAMERARQAQEEEVATVTAPAVPRPPPVDVVFLGSFGPASQRFAVFTDGSEIFNATEGDVLKDRFVVVRIGFESADLGFVGFPEAPAQRLEIGG